MDQNISIDINVTKLLDWLISRRHCQKDWQNDVLKIRNKINTALEDMPEHKGIAQLLSGSFINYFHCRKIVEILRETEADSKNIFGHYSSKRMKDWNEIISLYEKSNSYLAEAADIVISMNKYDIPNLKKQITKLKQTENDMKKKEVEAEKCGASLKNELAQYLKELGLPNTDSGFRSGLVESAKGLGRVHEALASSAKLLSEPMRHYVAFSQLTQPNIPVDLSLLEYVANKGNVTTFEYIKGHAPTEIILPQIDMGEEEEEVNCDTIDWGLPESSDNIEIDILDAGNFETNDATSKEISEKDKDVAEGEMALSLLDNLKTRTTFTNLLLELRAFLKLRLYECQTGSTLDSMTESTGSLEKMLAAVTDMLTTLNSPTVQHQYYLTHHPRYLEDILNKISQKKSGIERCATVVQVSRERAKEAAAQAVQLGTSVKAATQKCIVLQDQVAAEISKKYNGRDVFLIGGV